MSAPSSLPLDVCDTDWLPNYASGVRVYVAAPTSSLPLRVATTCSHRHSCEETPFTASPPLRVARHLQRLSLAQAKL